MGKTIRVSGFPVHVNADQVNADLESEFGNGVVDAIKLRPPKVIRYDSRACAHIQFQDEDTATKVFTQIKARGTLRYYTGLTVFWADRDIVPTRRTSMFKLEGVHLHAGCLISKQVLSVLWDTDNVNVTFGFDMNTIKFELFYKETRYKLVLSYESVWEIKLYRSSGKRYLLFQVQAAPKIYELLPYSNSIYESPQYNYYSEPQDDQWVRRTDFTPDCSIGQSFIFCLELPHNCSLPNIRHYFVYYEDIDALFELRHGSSYCRNKPLVPIVEAPPYCSVPYELLFKINILIQNGTLSAPTLDDKFFWLVSPRLTNLKFIERALENMSYLRKTCLDPSDYLQRLYRRYEKMKNFSSPPAISLDSGLVYVHRVQVTPSKVYFYGPEINVSNRVLRHFMSDISNFLRITFIDEDCEKIHAYDLSRRTAGFVLKTTLYTRILSVLKEGISVGGKKFEFLAFSASQLRDNSAWMFASRPGLSAADIRAWMGDFRNIRNVAKYAARLGQSFGSSTETLTVNREEVEMIPDIINSKYCFSDGVGKISADFATQVAKKCGSKQSFTSTFQIRYAGFKGVVAVDPTSSKKLSLRDSMKKFESENNKLDVLAYAKYQPCFLNRQLITLLSTLGVKDNAFEKKQAIAIRQLNQILTDPQAAIDAVTVMPVGETTNVVKELLLCGYKPDQEPYLAMLIQTFRASKLLELRTKSRIFIPDGRAMMGCLDETGLLNYGEVFVRPSYNGGDLEKYKFVVTGRVVVAKNPCLHPGDIRVLTALDIPELHHLVDSVVFPKRGPRPHPNECSGSDLDGDIYFVCWDPDLIPPRIEQPMDYTPAPVETLDHDVTIEEVQEYFANYILNDSLGIIANAHVVFADREAGGANCRPCLELAKLFSIAVDFPKTGVAAVIPSELRVKEYPDFMEKADRVTYTSHRVIGKLFRAVKEEVPNPTCVKSFTRDVAVRSYDRDMEYEGFQHYLEEAAELKDEYDFKLGNLMEHYGVKSEAEIVTGCILKMSKMFTKNNDGEAIRLAVVSLRKEARSWFKAEEEDAEQQLAKASAWYHVTYHPSYWGRYNEGLKRPHFVSFPWCVYEKLIKIKQHGVLAGVQLGLEQLRAR